MKRFSPFLDGDRPQKRPRSLSQSDYEADSNFTPVSSTGTSLITTPATPLTPKSLRRYPSDLKVLICDYVGCKKSFNRPAKLAQHIRSHTNTRPFACSVDGCEKTFLRQSHLSHHTKSAHSDVREYTCLIEGCGKSFVTATRLKRHEELHENREKFRCHAVGCGQSFRKRTTLEKHIISEHERRKPFTCNYLVKGKACGVAFDTAAKLKVHHGRVHGEIRFWCQTCRPTAEQGDRVDDVDGRMGFTTYKDLQEHLKTIHQPLCPQCGITFSNERNLKAHTEMYHEQLSIDERRTCVCPVDQCGLAFTTQSILRNHVRAKHDGRQFVCGDPEIDVFKKSGGWDRAGACGQPFPTKGNLERHISSVHLRIKSHKSLNLPRKAKDHGDRRRDDLLQNLTGESRGQSFEDEHGYSPWDGFTNFNDLDFQYDLQETEINHGHADETPDNSREEAFFGREDHDDHLRDEWLEDESEMRKLIS